MSGRQGKLAREIILEVDLHHLNSELCALEAAPIAFSCCKCARSMSCVLAMPHTTQQFAVLHVDNCAFCKRSAPRCSAAFQCGNYVDTHYNCLYDHMFTCYCSRRSICSAIASAAHTSLPTHSNQLPHSPTCCSRADAAAQSPTAAAAAPPPQQQPQQQLLPPIITAEQLQMLVEASVAAANDCTPGETFTRIETLLQQLMGATSVRLLHVSHWHHKLFHYRERCGSEDSDVDSESGWGDEADDDAGTGGATKRSSCRSYTLLQQSVFDVGEGVAGRAALSGQAVYIEDCSLSSVTVHDTGAKVTRQHNSTT
jgi:hypothetical protein